jgi:prepilin-type N-terminal cleavage/methylation domain-containing protein
MATSMNYRRHMGLVSRRVRCQGGFSLIELMVAIVAGMIVTGAVLAFTISSVRSNAEFVSATRLQQELRSTVDFISRDLRRSGYDQNYLAQMHQPVGSTAQSPFSPIGLSPSLSAATCAIYAYDRQPGMPGQLDPANGEIRGVRRVAVNGVGVIEVATTLAADPAIACNDGSADYSTYPPTCNGAWCPLTDPRQIDITRFEIDGDDPSDGGGSKTLIAGTGVAALPMLIRELQLNLQGRLVSDASVIRGVQTTVRVRADCLRSGMTPATVTPAAAENVAACTTAP